MTRHVIHLDSSHDDIRRSWNWHASGTAEVVVSCDSVTRQATVAVRGVGVVERFDDPLQALDWIGRYNLAEHPYGNARWVGYLGYDVGQLFERLPHTSEDTLQLPLFVFVLTHEPIPNPEVSLPCPDPASEFIESTFSRQAYERAVARCIEYISAGDVFQVNLSQRFTASTNMPAYQIYQRLQESGGAYYGAFLHFGPFALICHSPELFLHVTPDRRVVTRPIKGTRPVAPNMAGALQNSSKDQAELNMIVDLERNDLGRVCEIGSVRVTEPRTIETHPTVYHGVATIEGKLRSDVSLVDLLRATFPGGSVTGAPKIRAMEIIDELEPVRRGPYCGAIGYIAANGSMEFNVAIRTMIVKNGLVHIPVGGGIVADSDPIAEYEETLVKAQAMLAALGLSIDQARF